MTQAPRALVAIVEDHPLMRSSIETTLTSAGFAVVGHASSHEQLVELLPRHEAPDVVLVDLGLGSTQEGLRCLETVAELAPSAKAIVFSGFDDRMLVAESFARGAAAFVHKRTGAERLLEIVELVLAGKPFSVDGTTDDVVALTPREREILASLVRGLSNSEIGRELWITEKTVKFHLSNLYRKLGVETRAQAIAWALKR